MGLWALVCAATAVVARMDKIQPWLLKNADGKESLDFFAVMASRADLSGASLLDTKLEKGHFVRDSLRQTAQQSQASLQQYLRDKDISFQPFFIVNSILIQDGSPELMRVIAAREDVLRVEGNPTIKVATPLAMNMSAPSPNGIEPGVDFIGAPNVWADGFEVSSFFWAAGKAGQRGREKERRERKARGRKRKEEPSGSRFGDRWYGHRHRVGCCRLEDQVPRLRCQVRTGRPQPQLARHCQVRWQNTNI